MRQYILLGAACLTLLWSVFLFTTAYTDGASIVISEIGAYEATGEEWVEIVNVGESDIDLTDWKFWEADTNHGLTLVMGSDMALAPGEYAVITQNDVAFVATYPSTTATIIDSSWSTLNESGEAIGLRDDAGELVEEFVYPAAPDSSLERVVLTDPGESENNWKVHPDSNTVGLRNYWYEEESQTEENQLPTAIIIAPSTGIVDEAIMFDASGSIDPDGSIAQYSWDIDGASFTETSVNYSFTTAGSYIISLEVTDDMGGVGTASSTIVISDRVTTTTSTPTTTASLGLVINEALTNPTTGTEWIELYNTSTSTIDLSAYTLRDGVGTIASPTGTVSAGAFFVVSLQAAKLNNGGDIITLLAGETVVDSIAYGNWAGATLSAPKKGYTIARESDGSGEFTITTSPTEGTPNIITVPAEQSSGGGGGGSVPTANTEEDSSATAYGPRDVLINELVSDPADGKDEFVELYNNTENSIALDGWYILDGSEAKTVLEGTIRSKGFVVIEAPKGNLNNGGDAVTLYDGTDTLIDTISYGNWDDGNLSNNAPRADDPQSLARVVDGRDSDYDAYDFSLTYTVTPGASNIIASVLGEIVSLDGTTAQKGQIIISEVLPNPDGSDTDTEFIELYNAGETDVSLDDWQLGDGSKTRYTFAGTTIAAGAYFTIYRSDSKIALNNSGTEVVTLYGPNETTIDSVTYSGSVRSGESYARVDSTWSWTTTPTPGGQNSTVGSTTHPDISISVSKSAAVGDPLQFDASDTTADGAALTFDWKLGDDTEATGDVVTHTYMTPGVYTVELTVRVLGSDTLHTQEVIVTVGYSGTASSAPLSNLLSVQITEVLPNPEGSDDSEFVELFNPTDSSIDLSGMKLDDEDGGSRAYAFPDGTQILARQYVVLGKQDTGIAFNNTSDSARLLYPDGTVLLSIDYEGASEGASYILNEEGAWQWSGTQTPGAPNIVTVATAPKTRSISKDDRFTQSVIQTSLEYLRSEDIGDMVSVSGVVAVLPGVLGTQYFYIVGSPGVQVYMYSKEFPELHVGDRVRVTGELSEALGETRIKVRSTEDIEIIDHVGMPTPVGVDIADIGEPYEGWLVGVDGEITELKSSYMYVDDGTAEVKVYFKRGANIPASTYEVGELVRVIGIVSQTKTGYQLLPRGSVDITTTGMATSAVIDKQIEKEAEQEETIEKYLTATAGGLTSIILGLGIKEHGGKIQLLLLRLYKRFRKR